MNLNTILFDFGGTLNTNGDHWGALFCQRMSEEFPNRSIEELEQAYIQAERELVRIGLHSEGMGETLEQQIRLQLKHLGEQDETIALSLIDEFTAQTNGRLYAIQPVLESLAKHFSLGVVSNYYGNLAAICEEADLDQYFKILIDSAVIGVRKPDTAIWLRAIERLGTTPAATIIVGDSWKNDISPGNQIGATTVWYRGLEWRPALPDQTSDFTITSFEDLLDLEPIARLVPE